VEENGKKKTKPLGQDKDSLTEWQRKQTVTKIILIRRISKTKGIHRATLSHRLMPGALRSPDSPPQLSTQHDVTWY